MQVNARVRSLGTGLAVAAVMAATIGLSRPVTSPSVIAENLQQTGTLRWYRGNLHTHSLWSDGDDYLEMIALWYREHGYDFLGFTDHNLLANKDRWVEIDKARGGRKAYDKLKAQFRRANHRQQTGNSAETIRRSLCQVQRAEQVFVDSG